MTDTIKLLKAHRSIRRYTDRPVDPELFNELLRAGQSAATSSFIQATTVIRVSDADIREQFVELSGSQKYIAQAAEFLVFCADLKRNQVRSGQAEEDFSWAEQLITATVDVALFAQNLVVAAESAGLGICYIGGIRNNPARVSELLSLPKLVYPVFGLCLGYPDQNPGKKPRLPLEPICHQDKYAKTEQFAGEIDRYDKYVRDYYVERSNGKLEFTWSEQIKKQAATQSRPFMLDFLNKKGFINK